MNEKLEACAKAGHLARQLTLPEDQQQPAWDDLPSAQREALVKEADLALMPSPSGSGVVYVPTKGWAWRQAVDEAAPGDAAFRATVRVLAVALGLLEASGVVAERGAATIRA